MADKWRITTSNTQHTTLCISNGGQCAKNETNMNIINNNSAIMNRSAVNPALRIANRCAALKNRMARYKLAKLLKFATFANFCCMFVL